MNRLLLAPLLLGLASPIQAGIYRYPTEGIHLECDDGKPHHWVIIKPGRYMEDRGNGAAIFEFPLSVKELYADKLAFKEYFRYYPYKDKINELRPYDNSSKKLWHDNWAAGSRNNGVIKYACKYRKMNKKESDALLKDAIKMCTSLSFTYFYEHKCGGWN